MKTFKILLLLLTFLITGVLLSASSVWVDKTTIYIVRHGEKDLSDPKNPNPELNEAGRQRAQDLAKKLRKQKIDAVFSTDYKRTMNTVAPIAKREGISIEFYDPKNPKALAERIRRAYANKKVLIAGHSNTVLEIVEAFGCQRPMIALTEEDYDLLFKIKFKGTSALLETRRYGSSHHVTAIESN